MCVCVCVGGGGGGVCIAMVHRGTGLNHFSVAMICDSYWRLLVKCACVLSCSCY